MEATRLNRVSRLTAVSSAQAGPRRLNVSRALFAAALVAVATALPAAANAPQSLIVPRLYAKVSASRISVTNQSGARVRLLQRNEYRIVVSDSTTAQNFHLTGPGVNRKTGVAATTKTTWMVQLSPGRYVFRSDKTSTLRGSFEVKGPQPARAGR
jgi:hypothetical protein